MRCTAPMNAPGPDPTMPKRRASMLALIGGSTGTHTFLPICETQHSAVRFRIGARFCEIIKRTLCGLDDVMSDERGTLLRALFTTLRVPWRQAMKNDSLLGPWIR